MKEDEKKIFAYGYLTIDEIDEEYMPGGVINLAKTWSVFINPERICLVSQIGDDFYARIIDERIREINVNTTYIKRVKYAATRRYHINAFIGQNPVFRKTEDAPKLQETPSKPIPLHSVALIFYQSLDAIFDAPCSYLILQTMEEAHKRGTPTVLDMNIRPAFVEKVKQNRSITHLLQTALDYSDTLKVNEAEAYFVFHDFDVHRPLEGIYLRGEELLRVADSIYTDYNLKNLIVTCGERGSYLQTEEGGILFKALKLHNFRNSLGCGDAFSAGYCLKYILDLTNTEAITLGTILASILTLEDFAYPEHLSKQLIIDMINRNQQFLFRNGVVDVDEFLSKLNLA